MFGYVTPLKPELKIREFNQFRSYYCGVCFHIKKYFGNIPRITLNYDMTFLALLLDGLNPKELEVKMKKCIVHPIKEKPIVLNNEALFYAASMNVSLFYYKLLDDIEDDNNVKSKIEAFFLSPYKKKFKNEILHINDIIKENLNLLTKFEKEKNFSSIDEICDPFSKIVGEILSKYPYSINKDSDELRSNLYNFGYSLGKWIYLIDALDDLEEDIKNNKFNPINFLYNKDNLPYKEFLENIEKRLEFSIFNCAYTCKEILEILPLTRNKEILENIINLGMMDKYMKITNKCDCTKKKGREI